MSNPGMVTTLLKSIKCEIKIEIQLDGKSISCLIPSKHLSKDKDTGDIISNALCVQTLYGYIVNQTSQENCDWFNREQHEHVANFFNSKIDAFQESGKRLHLRGLSYPHHGNGMAISILHDFAKLILQKYGLDKNFIFYFSLDKTLSADASLLATVTTVWFVVWEEHLSRTSDSILKKTEGERLVIYVEKQCDEDEDEDVSTTASAYYRNKDGNRLPLAANDRSTGFCIDNIHIGAPFATPEDKKPRAMVDIPTTYNKSDNRNAVPPRRTNTYANSNQNQYLNQHHSNQHHCSNQQHHSGQQHYQPGPRRYSIAQKNIPGASTRMSMLLPLGKVLLYDVDETPESRLASLLAMASGRIPEQRHRNFGTATKESRIDKECFLVWYHSFVKRCVTKNIYCPDILSYIPTSYMGLE